MGILLNQHKATASYYDICQTLMPNKLPKSKTTTIKKEKLSFILHYLASKAPPLIQLPSKLHIIQTQCNTPSTLRTRKH